MLKLSKNRLSYHQNLQKWQTFSLAVLTHEAAKPGIHEFPEELSLVAVSEAWSFFFSSLQSGETSSLLSVDFSLILKLGKV